MDKNMPKASLVDELKQHYLRLCCSPLADGPHSQPRLLAAAPCRNGRRANNGAESIPVDEQAPTGSRLSRPVLAHGVARVGLTSAEVLATSNSFPLWRH